MKNTLSIKHNVGKPIEGKIKVEHIILV